MKVYGFLFSKVLASQEGKIFLPVLLSALLSYFLSESCLLSCVRTVPPILCWASCAH